MPAQIFFAARTRVQVSLGTHDLNQKSVWGFPKEKREAVCITSQAYQDRPTESCRSQREKERGGERERERERE